MKVNSAKKILAIVLSVLMIFSSMVFATSAVDFDSSWTAITNAAELKAIANDMSGKYYLANDITLSGEWTPIGWGEIADVPFEGEFDGNGYTVYGLTMDNTVVFNEEYVDYSASNIGLFSVNDGTISNLTIDSPYIVGGTQVGAVVGLNNGTVSKCSVVNGTVTGGFVLAEQEWDSYWGSYSFYHPDFVEVDGKQFGAIAGLNYGTIEKCENIKTNVSGWCEIGGICGANYGTIEQCSSTGYVNKCTDEVQNNRLMYAASAQQSSKVSGYNFYHYDAYAYVRMGGIVGKNYETGTVQDVYVYSGTTGDEVYVGGLNTVGGICGSNIGVINNAYAAGVKLAYPSANSTIRCMVCDRLGMNPHTLTLNYNTCYVHWTVGDNLDGQGTSTNCFYTAPATNAASLPPRTRNAIDRGSKVNSASLLENADMFKAAGWDFDNVWTIDPDLNVPVFGWQTEEIETPECEHNAVKYTDNGDGTHTGVCNDCGATIVAGENHMDNNNDHKCDKCLKVLCDGTNLVYTDNGDGTHTGKCAVCNKVWERNKPHVDENTDGKCDKCQATVEVECTHESTKWVDNGNGTHSLVCQNPDCGEVLETGNCVDTNKDHKCDVCKAPMGEHADTNNDHKCEYCGEKVSDHIDDDPEDNHCDICGAFLGTGNGGTGDVTAEHSKDGLEWIYVDENNHDGKCKTCNKIIVQHAPHVWDEEKTTTTATCTEAGVTTKTCSLCGGTVETETPALGHDWGEWTEVTASTCEVAGSEKRECQREGCDEVETRALPLAAHTPVSANNGTAATCTTAGKEADTVCGVCGALIEAGKVIPAAGHKWDNGVVTKQPTCSETGIKTFTCTVCGEKTTTTIAATGSHQDNDNDGLCDTCGKELSHVDKDGNGKCDHCGKDLGTSGGSHIDTSNCDCWCHRTGKLYKVFWKLAFTFYKLFGTHRVCKCGIYHF